MHLSCQGPTGVPGPKGTAGEKGDEGEQVQNVMYKPSLCVVMLMETIHESAMYNVNGLDGLDFVVNVIYQGISMYHNTCIHIA